MACHGSKTTGFDLGKFVLPYREKILIQPDNARIADLLQSVRWVQAREPASLMVYFLAQVIYPKVASICADLGFVPLHDSQNVRIFGPRPKDIVHLQAEFAEPKGNGLLVVVRLDDPAGIIWAEAKMSFLLRDDPRARPNEA